MRFFDLLLAASVSSALARPDFQQDNELNKISAKVNIPFYGQVFLVAPAYTDKIT
jgi:hypothetical protein